MTRRASGKTAYGEVNGTITVSSAAKFEKGAFLLERRALFEFDGPICPASFRADIDAALAKWDAAEGLWLGLSPNTIGSTTSDGSDLDAGLKAFASGNFEHALSLLRPLAEKGNVEAQIRMAMIFRDGKGVKPDPEVAFDWSRKAADTGSAYGREILAWAYEMGRGTARDLVMAAKLYEMAAVAGRPYAQSRLGVFYRYGSGVPRDDAKAVEWLKKAADGGYAPALVDLGSMYENGLGTPKDLDRAAVLYDEAARRGDKRGSERLGAISGGSR